MIYKNNTHIMGFKKWVKYNLMRESRKEIELNRILDKISKKVELTTREKNFLSLYDTTTDDDFMDFTYLSSDVFISKIRELLDKNKRVVNEITSKGENNSGVEIRDIKYKEDNVYLLLENGKTQKVSEKCLYNILYDIDRDSYSVQVQDEYYELIPTKDDEQ